MRPGASLLCPHACCLVAKIFVSAPNMHVLVVRGVTGAPRPIVLRNVYVASIVEQEIVRCPTLL